ncbi:hypothetical protein [Proteus mirabilis]|uniref:hypothetical protein n=1 Tax=Proteus mirabilis TaxID=584 RepID=UPI000C7C7331|nr:hypothetical protein [Proteus mirabilis]PLB10751.1 hypothetical protein CYK02_01760 [Proteus mirabilis]
MSLELAIKENTEVMRQLIATMQSGAVVQTKVTLQPNEKPQPTKNKIKATIKPVDINTLELNQLVALAVLFKGEIKELTTEQLSQVTETLTAKGDKRNAQVDALYVALVNLDEITNLDNNTIHDLCLEMLENWDDMPSVTERREYAVALLNEGKAVSKEPEPEPEPEKIDPKTLLEQAEKLILQLAKGGYRNEAVEILSKFGAKKLGQVPENNLAELITLAEKVLEA